jgi:hypothetical protein
MAVAELSLLILAAYLACGLVFGLAFACWGSVAIDPAARGMPLWVRVLILPGAAALWPWLLPRWLRRQPPPVS